MEPTETAEDPFPCRNLRSKEGEIVPRGTFSGEDPFPCRNLRSKAMYYQGEDDDGIFWCAQTQENVGPDGAPTGKTECCNRRACYVG